MEHNDVIEEVDVIGQGLHEGPVRSAHELFHRDRGPQRCRFLSRSGAWCLLVVVVCLSVGS